MYYREAMSKPEAKTSRGVPIRHIAGLDTMRFLAALCVVFSHQLFPLAAYVPQKTGIWAVLVGLNNTVFNGFAAVIVFFVISGFCIHYPYACGQKVLSIPFLSRRLLRIAIPAACAVALADICGPEARFREDTVLWSLYYEMIYYLIYPALRIFFMRFGLPLVIACSTVTSVVLIAFHWDNSQYWEFPISYGWLVTFPAWLLGCLLAERIANNDVSRREDGIWIWRLLGFCYGAFSLAYFYHGPIKIGVPALLFPFIFYSYFWIDREISYMRATGVSPLLEWGGKWSYSVYIVHIIVLVGLRLSFAIDPALFWVIKLAVALVASYCFYLLVEWPAHWLARSVSQRLAKQLVF